MVLTHQRIIATSYTLVLISQFHPLHKCAGEKGIRASGEGENDRNVVTNLKLKKLTTMIYPVARGVMCIMISRILRTDALIIYYQSNRLLIIKLVCYGDSIK